ncbi:hypothetical protein ACROYT_G025384 [Oculina patagonica]
MQPRRTRIVSEASSVRLGKRSLPSYMITYASRCLNDVERWHSQTEKEAQALVWACECFNISSKLKGMISIQSCRHFSSTTGAASFYLMFEDLQRETTVTNEEVCDRDWSRKLSQNEYVDARRRATESEVEIGDQVLLRNMKTNKLSLNYNPSPGEVIIRKEEK